MLEGLKELLINVIDMSEKGTLFPLHGFYPIRFFYERVFNETLFA